MLNILSFMAETNAGAIAVAVARLVLAILIIVCAGFIVFVVMKQSGDTDGTEALTGSSKSSDDQDSYYGKNKSKSADAKLKMWTYICAGVMAIACIVFLILG